MDAKLRPMIEHFVATVSPTLMPEEARTLAEIRAYIQRLEAAAARPAEKQMSSDHWGQVIEYAKAKLERTRLYITQLEAMILWFQAQREAGEPCPTEVSKTFREGKHSARPVAPVCNCVWTEGQDPCCAIHGARAR